MTAPSTRSSGTMLPAALLLCIVTVALSTALQRSQHDLTVSSALEALDLRARHAVDAAYAWVRAAGADRAPGTLPTQLTFDGFSVNVERHGTALEFRVEAEGHRHRERRQITR